MPDKGYGKRTVRQNKSLHLLFGMLADSLNEAGLDQRKVLKESVDIPWTKEAVKNQIWRPVMEAQLGIKSTTQMTTVNIDEVFDTINRHLGEKFGLHVNFPSNEEVILREENHAI